MKRIIGLILQLALLAVLPAAAQVSPGTSQTYTWANATTGASNAQLGSYLMLTNTNFPRPATQTVDVSVTGTAPSVCTFRVEGSSDGTKWYGLDVTSPSTTSCTTSYMESIINRPVQLLRIVVTYTQGDATTSVIFHWTGGKS